ncbi:MAG: helix-turn-helix transcriptional regulator [Micropruina sp.]
MSELSAVLEVSRRLGSCESHDAFRLSAREGLRWLIDCDAVIWTGIDMQTASAVVEGEPYDQLTLADGLIQYAVNHPAITSYLAAPGDLTPRRVSDVVDGRRWKNSAIYCDVFRPLRALFQLNLVISLRPPAVGEGLVLIRETSDFTADDVATATHLLPVLVALNDRFIRPSLESWVLRPSDVPAPGLSSTLTPREHETLRMLSRGLTAQAIAHQEGISVRTVRKHLEHVYSKLDVHDRLLAVDKARARGLLSFDQLA